MGHEHLARQGRSGLSLPARRRLRAAPLLPEGYVPVSRVGQRQIVARSRANWTACTALERRIERAGGTLRSMRSRRCDRVATSSAASWWLPTSAIDSCLPAASLQAQSLVDPTPALHVAPGGVRLVHRNRCADVPLITVCGVENATSSIPSASARSMRNAASASGQRRTRSRQTMRCTTSAASSSGVAFE